MNGFETELRLLNIFNMSFFKVDIDNVKTHAFAYEHLDGSSMELSDNIAVLSTC